MILGLLTLASISGDYAKAANMRSNIINRLSNAESLPAPSTLEGAVLIGKLPPRADGLFQDCYLHEIYDGLTEAELSTLPGLLGKPVPSQLRGFYSEMNGLSLYCGSLSVSGLVKSHVRSSPIRQPISLEYGNTIDKPRRSDRSAISLGREFRFGFYASGPGFEVVCGFEDDRVFMVPRYKTGPILMHWNNFSHFISEEIDRMSGVYLARGKVCDPLNVIPAPNPNPNPRKVR